MNAIGRPLEPLITVPDSACGPAMLALSPPMRAFVAAYVYFGCTRAEAARRAGYSKNKPDNAKVTAHDLWRREDVQVAILEESRKLMRAEGPRSIKTLIDIRDDKGADKKVRVKAATELLNRCGLAAVQESHVLVEHQLSEAEKDRRILSLATELGLSQGEARKLLIDPKNVVDAEYSEVPTEPLTPEDETTRAARGRENDLRRLRRSMSPEALAEHKRQMNEQRRANAKAKYTEAKGQTDLEAYLAGRDPDDISDMLAPAPGGSE
jgi:hypothetical protein